MSQLLNTNLVCFAGRKQSGKTTLANWLIAEHGFERISFAQPLKEAVSTLYDLPFYLMNDPVFKASIFKDPFYWNDEKASQLEEYFNLPKNSLDRTPKEFFSLRNILQYIGTNVLRNYDYDFHIKELEKIINKNYNKKYVIDDCRFANELKILRKKNAICIFIIRPSNFEYSNHESETSLDRFDIEYYMNDSSLDEFINGFRIYYNNLLRRNETNSVFSNRNSFKCLCEEFNFNTKLIAKKCGVGKNKIIKLAKKHLIYLPNVKYSYNNDVFSKKKLTPEAAYFAGIVSTSGNVKSYKKSKANIILSISSNNRMLVERFKKFVETNKPICCRKKKTDSKTIYTLNINSPFIIDDLKFWDLCLRKHNNGVPSIISKNEDLIKYWIVGLIDGSESCGADLNILASKKIIEFIEEICINNSIEFQEKNIGNLYNMVFFGNSAIKFIEFLGDAAKISINKNCGTQFSKITNNCELINL